MSQCYTYICCRLELETPKLTSIDEIIEYCVKLKSVANDIFDKFAQGIKQNYWSEGLRHVVRRFVGFRNYNSC